MGKSTAIIAFLISLTSLGCSGSGSNIGTICSAFIDRAFSVCDIEDNGDVDDIRDAIADIGSEEPTEEEVTNQDTGAIQADCEANLESTLNDDETDIDQEQTDEFLTELEDRDSCSQVTNLLGNIFG